jgi:hypothetical protein
VYFKSPWSLSHSKAVCLLALAIACLMFIATKLSQKVTQDPHIHYRMILNPRALLPNRWAFRLARLHGHIVACPQMLYHVVLGCIRCIAPINPTNKFGHIPCPMDTLYGNWRRGNHIYRDMLYGN